jgi:tetratricopeptide (TPR) repeat protein
MSPEQVSGRPEAVGPASDIYSLGATLYRLLTGRPPFAEGLLDRLANQGDFPPPRQVKKSVPRAMEAICLKAMQTRARDRYATALALAADIEHWLADEPVAAYREPARVRARRWVRRHKALVSGAAAALVVGLIGLSASLVWYHNQDAEAAARSAAVAEAIGRHLEQGRQKRQELHAALGEAGGVQRLLNQPGRWQALLQAARSQWQTAQDVAARAEQPLAPDLANALRKMDQELTRDEADYRLAGRLEKIRLDKAIVIEGKFNEAQAKQEYRRAFAAAGLAVRPGRERAVAARIRPSAIKEQLVAALDDWAWAAFRDQERDLCGRLLATARLADPHPVREQLRSLRRWQQPQRMVRLAEDLQRDPKRMTQLSPQLLVVVQLLFPDGKQEKWLRRAQALHPADFWINHELAHVLALNNQSLEAAGFFRVALALRPDTAAAYNNLGVALAAQKDLPGAIAAFKKAVAIEPKDAPHWYNLGSALYARQDARGAIAAFKKAVALNSKFAPAWHNLGIAFNAQKDLPAAIASFKKALAIEPKYAKAWYNLASVLVAQHDLPGALAAYRKALALDPQFADAWNNLGNALAARHDWPAAIDAYRKALALDPQLAPAWYNLGIALNAQNDLPGAIAAYRKAVALVPTHAKAWNNLGLALAARQDLPAAIDAYRKALFVEPEVALTWHNLGTALHARQDLPAAIAAFQAALKINPNFAHAHAGLGMSFLDHGDFADAAAATKRALQSLPHGDSVRTSWKQMLNQCQQLLSLERRLPDALKGRKLRPAEYLVLADLCVRHKARYRDAVELYLKGFAAEPNFAHDPKTGLRYNAACAASLAAAGKGVSAANLPDREKSRLRQQALAWLRADLAAWCKLLEHDPKAAAGVTQTFRHWQHDPDLAGLREPAALVKLPEPEARACRQLWADVQALLERSGRK